MSIFGKTLTCNESQSSTKPIRGNTQISLLKGLPGLTVDNRGNVSIAPNTYPDIKSNHQLDFFAKQIARETPVTIGYEKHRLIYEDSGKLYATDALDIPLRGGATIYECRYKAEIIWHKVVAIWHTHPFARGIDAKRENRDYSFLSPGDAFTCLKRMRPIFMREPYGFGLSVLECVNNQLQVRVLVGSDVGTIKRFDARPEKS